MTTEQSEKRISIWLFVLWHIIGFTMMTVVFYLDIFREPYRGNSTALTMTITAIGMAILTTLMFLIRMYAIKEKRKWLVILSGILRIVYLVAAIVFALLLVLMLVLVNFY